MERDTLDSTGLRLKLGKHFRAAHRLTDSPSQLMKADKRSKSRLQQLFAGVAEEMLGEIEMDSTQNHLLLSAATCLNTVLMLH